MFKKTGYLNKAGSFTWIFIGSFDLERISSKSSLLKKYNLGKTRRFVSK